MPYKDGKPTLMEQFDDADAHAQMVGTYEKMSAEEAVEAMRKIASLEAQTALFKDTIRYVAENTHQAYHQDSIDGWWACKKNVCTAAQKAIPEYAAWLAGKGPKP